MMIHHLWQLPFRAREGGVLETRVAIPLGRRKAKQKHLYSAQARKNSEVHHSSPTANGGNKPYSSLSTWMTA